MESGGRSGAEAETGGSGVGVETGRDRQDRRQTETDRDRQRQAETQAQAERTNIGGPERLLSFRCLQAHMNQKASQALRASIIAKRGPFACSLGQPA